MSALGNDVKDANLNEAHKVIYPLGASYYQFDNRTPNELFSDTIWEYRGKVQSVPVWVRIK